MGFIKQTAQHLAAASLAVTLGVNAQAAQKVDLNVAVGTPVMLAGKKQTAFLKISLNGFELQGEQDRTPVNVAIVLDKSGSMRGEKISQARRAATLAIEQLSQNDIAAIVSYDSTVKVVVPATKVDDKRAFGKRIERINAGGKTALFAGVSKGAYEAKKFLDRNRVNRIILLSDGLANVGPSSPSELGRLGASLSKEGLTITTIGLGLGYNEDLMTQLAGMSDGNHAFAEDAADLARLFRAEFGDVLSVVAQQVNVKIRCGEGIRPIRVLGRDADIVGQTVHVSLNQLYSEQEKFILLEVEVPPGMEHTTQQIADVQINYFNTVSKVEEKLVSSAAVRFSGSEQLVTEETDGDVMSDTVSQIANIMSKEAIELRDKGQVKEAQQQLRESAAYIKRNAVQYDSAELDKLSSEFEQDAEALEDEGNWNRTRKQLRKKQYSVDVQQKY